MSKKQEQQIKKVLVERRSNVVFSIAQKLIIILMIASLAGAICYGIIQTVNILSGNPKIVIAHDQNENLITFYASITNKTLSCTKEQVIIGTKNEIIETKACERTIMIDENIIGSDYQTNNYCYEGNYTKDYPCENSSKECLFDYKEQGKVRVINEPITINITKSEPIYKEQETCQEKLELGFNNMSEQQKQELIGYLKEDGLTKEVAPGTGEYALIEKKILDLNGEMNKNCKEPPTDYPNNLICAAYIYRDKYTIRIIR